MRTDERSDGRSTIAFSPLHFTLAAKLSLLDDKLDLMLSYTQTIYPDRDIAPRGRVPRDPNDPDGPTWTDIESIGLDDGERVPDAAGLYEHSIGMHPDEGDDE